MGNTNNQQKVLITVVCLYKQSFSVRHALRRKAFFTRFTFQIQIFGPIDNLSDHLGVHFQAVCVAIIPSDDDIVPLVVIQGTVAVPFDHIGTIPEVKHVVYVSRKDRKHSIA